jgi:hypothetical protein
MRKKRNTLAHFISSEWDRIYQIVKVEEPASVRDVHRFCRRDLNANQVECVLFEMLHAKKVKREGEGAEERFSLAI